MARDYYETTIALPDSLDGNALKPLSAIKVSVVPRGATDIVGSVVNIYQADTGVAKGPDPKSGATGTNPFTTGASGAVRFWADGPAEYDVVFEDTQTPARVSDKIGWNAIPSKPASFPTSYLAADGGITQAMLSAAVIYQQVPIGGVIEWWRPQQSVPVPLGFEICDGHPVATHEFPGVAGSVALPNLQNVFILGATTAGKNDGDGASGDDNSAGAPGIRGTGGSNQHLLDPTQMPSHNHAGSTTAGTAATGSMNRNNPHAHQVLGGNSGGVPPNYYGVASGFQFTGGTGSGYGIAVTTVGSYGWTLFADNTNIDHEHTVPILGLTITPNGSSQPHNNMPKWVGLLRLIKVRRT